MNTVRARVNHLPKNMREITITLSQSHYATLKRILDYAGAGLVNQERALHAKEIHQALIEAEVT